MEAWLLSLALTLAISLSSLIPGALDARLGDDLTREARKVDPGAMAIVHVVGDPVLELPWGNVPHLAVKFLGLHARGLPLSEVRINLDHVHVNPWNVLSRRPANLLSPADAALAVRLSRNDLQGALEQQLARIHEGDFAFELPLLGRVSPTILHADVQLSGGRVSVVGELTLKPGAAPKAFTASVALAALNGQQLVATAPQLTLGAMTVPSFLLASLATRIPPLLALGDLPLPPGKWLLETPVIDDTGLELRAKGTVTALPGHEGNGATP